MSRAPITSLPGRPVGKNVNQWADIQSIDLWSKAQCVCEFCKSEMSYVATAPLTGNRLRYVCDWCGQRWNVRVMTEPSDAPDDMHPQFGLY